MTVKTQIASEGARVDDLNFGYPPCNSVIVDNYSGTWFSVPATGRLIPPWTQGWVSPLLTPAQTCQSAFTADPVNGSEPAIPANPGQVRLTWTSDVLSPSNGVSIFTSVTAGVLVPLNVGLQSVLANGLVAATVGALPAATVKTVEATVWFDAPPTWDMLIGLTAYPPSFTGGIELALVAIPKGSAPIYQIEIAVPDIYVPQGYTIYADLSAQGAAPGATINFGMAGVLGVAR